MPATARPMAAFSASAVPASVSARTRSTALGELAVVHVPLGGDSLGVRDLVGQRLPLGVEPRHYVEDDAGVAVALGHGRLVVGQYERPPAVDVRELVAQPSGRIEQLRAP